MNLISYLGAVVGSINYLSSFSIGTIKRSCKKDKFGKKDFRNKNNKMKLAKKQQRSFNIAASGPENNLLGSSGAHNISPKGSSFIPFSQDNQANLGQNLSNNNLERSSMQLEHMQNKPEALDFQKSSKSII